MKASYITTCLSDVNLADGEVFFTKHNITATCSERFWKSLRKVLKINSKLFDYFSDEEVFDRVIAKNGNISFKFCIEQEGNENIALGVSNLESTIPSLQDIVDNAASKPSIDLQYSRGEIATTYLVSNITDSKKDKVILKQFDNQFVLLYTYHVDLLSKPTITLGVKYKDSFLAFNNSLLTCEFSPENDPFRKCSSYFFRSRRYNTGKQKSKITPIEALELRISAANRSACSLNDIAGFFKILVRDKVTLERFDQMLNFPFEKFGLSTHNALSSTRLAKLPTKSTINDLFEIIALARESCSPIGKQRLDKYVGKLIASYYDFENCLYEELLAEFKGEEIEEEQEEEPKTDQEKLQEEIESIDLSLFNQDDSDQDDNLDNVIPFPKRLKCK